MNLSTEKKIMDLKNRLVVAQGKGVVGVGSLRLTDANYCSWNGLRCDTHTQWNISQL